MKQNYSIPIRGVLICTLLWLATTVAFAQRTVTGKVTDAKGEGIPGTSVLVKGTKTGAISDANGAYKIAIPNNGGTLVFSSIGYLAFEQKLAGQSVIDVTLQDDAATLDEVVVTGYQTENRKEITGAVSTVKAKDLNAVPSGNVEQQLQGKVSGLTIITNGQPGTDSKVRVRGFGAFGGNEPLYVVDGVPTSSVGNIAPSDIENTTVLKDAAAASIYGARASNGVIVITTKIGVKGAKKLAINYEGTYGVTTAGKGFSVMGPQAQADWTWNALKNTGITPSHPQYGTGASPVLPDYLLDVNGNSGIIGSVDMAAQKAGYSINPTSAAGVHQLIKANKTGTDWWAAVTRMAPTSRHSLSFSGATDNARYYIGLSIQNQSGILLYNDFARYIIRTNTQFDVTKHFRIGENMQVSYTSVRGQQGNNNGQDVANSESDILTVARMSPIIPIYDEFGGWAGTRAKGFNNPRNPVAARTYQKDNKGYNISTFGNIYGEYDIIPGLTLRSTVGGIYNNYFSNYYSPQTYENSENNSSYSYGENYGFNSQWNFTNTLAYKKKMGMHSINAIIGEESLNTGLGLYGPSAAGRGISSSGLNPFSTDPNFVNLSTVGSKVVNSYNSLGVNMFSYFGKVDYSYNEKYILSATLRRDGSSSFGSNNRYGVFPAFSAAWRISSESFMKELPFITDLKIRGGWGQMGNAINVPPSNQFNLYGQGIGVSAYDITGSNGSQTGFYRSQIGNANAKWETNTTSNIGFDGTFMNGKMEVVFDVWRKDTKDLLFQPTVPATIGSSANAPFVNVGAMRNQGIDIQIINRGKISGDWTFETNVTGSFLSNKIVSLSSTTPQLDFSAPRFGTAIRDVAGQPLSSFFGYQVLGLFQSAAEVTGAAKQSGAGVGRFRYSDINGDGVIDDKDRTFLGSPIPKFTGGLNLTAKYKGFEFSTFLYTSIGNKIYNFTRWYTDFYPSFTGAAISTRVLNSWSPSNTGATIPIFENTANFSTNTQSSSYYVEDGSYLRMQNLQIAYNLPASLLKNAKLEKVRVYVQATNLFTVTKYSGLDPGVGGSADTNFGMDVGNYPVTRGYNVGVAIGF